MEQGFADAAGELDALDEQGLNLEPIHDVYEFVCEECFTIQYRGAQCINPALKGCSETQHCIGCCNY